LILKRDFEKKYLTNLFYILSPTHLISALSAYFSMQQNEEDKIVILIHWANEEELVLEELNLVIENMVKGVDYVKKIVTISFQEKNRMLYGKKIKSSILRLKTYIGYDNFDMIYYPHDMEGGMFRFICASYPNSERICFGDALGGVFERSYNTRLISQGVIKKIYHYFALKLKEIIAKLSIKTIDLSILLKEITPHKAALIIPVDQSGYFLKNLPLLVCPKEKVQLVINTMNDNLVQINQYIKLLLSEEKIGNRYLLITDNFAEVNIMEFEKEVEMYCSIINDCCPENSVIYLKSHPGEYLPRNQRIKEILSSKYKIIELDIKYKRYPIELWKELLLNVNIICMSSPILTLKYLYNIDVINPMDNKFIEKWFPVYWWNSIKDGISLQLEPLKRLNSWNGQGVLYSGSRE